MRPRRPAARWAAEIVEARPAGPTRRVGSLDAPEGPALVDFVAEGYRLLADVLALGRGRRAVLDVDRSTDRALLGRRQANELAVHRWDAQPRPARPNRSSASSPSTASKSCSTSSRSARGPPTGNGETIHLHCTDGDGEWLIRLGAHGVSVVNEHAKGDVAARGTASDLLLMMWGRIPVDQVEVFGDASLLARWSDGKL